MCEERSAMSTKALTTLSQTFSFLFFLSVSQIVEYCTSNDKGGFDSHAGKERTDQMWKCVPWMKKKRCPILVSVSNYIYKSDFLESTLKWLFNVSNYFCENGCYNFLSSFSVTNVAYEKMNQYTVLWPVALSAGFLMTMSYFRPD